jgi:hypothetical protein
MRLTMGATGSTDRAIRKAITEKRLIEFSLHGLLRVAEPHDYGLRNGSDQLLVYQVGGKSRSGGLPNWRWVKVAEMSELKLLKATFEGNREAPSGRHSAWDELYLRVAG